MIGILWGLLGAVFIGISDGVARETSRRVSLPVLVTLIMSLSCLAITGVMAVTGGWPVWDAYAWGAAAGSGILNLVALGFLYTALRRGPVTVASPAASSFVIMLVGLNALGGHSATWLQGLAALVVFFGVAMLARPDATSAKHYDAARLRGTALFALGCAFAVSLRMYLAQDASDVLTPFTALYLTRVFATLGCIVMLAVLWLRGSVPILPRGQIWVLILLQATLEMLALWVFLTGSDMGRVGASIGFAAFAAITAITAWVWLKEPIGTRRAVWMAVVACGVILAVLGTDS